MKPTVSSKIAFQNPYLRIRSDRYLHPVIKKEFSYDFVEKPPAVIIIAEEDGQIVFIRHYRYPHDAESLELPIGQPVGDETPLQAAKRELREEAGILAKEWTAIGSFWEVPGWCSSDAHVFLARGLTHVPPGREPTELDMVLERHSLTEAKKLIASDAIKEGDAIAALFKYDLYLHNMNGSPRTLS